MNYNDDGSQEYMHKQIGIITECMNFIGNNWKNQCQDRNHISQNDSEKIKDKLAQYFIFFKDDVDNFTTTIKNEIQKRPLPSSTPAANIQLPPTSPPTTEIKKI